MKIKVEIESDGQITTVEKECEGCLTEVAEVFSSSTTAAFGYTVEAALATDLGSWDREGLLQ